MADGFDVVTVRIENERRVLMPVIVRTQPRLAIVPPAGRDSRLMEGVDPRPIRGGEGDVKLGQGLSEAVDPEVRLGRTFA
jgi:hypothetical protein